MILINEMSNCRIVDNLWHPKANEAVSLRACVAALYVQQEIPNGTMARWHDSISKDLLADSF